MAVVETEVYIELSGGINIKYYESLGYTIPKGKYGVKRGTKLLVKVEHLPNNSNVRLTKKCDICGKTSETSYNAITNARLKGDGLDRCVKCGKEKASESRRLNVKYEKSLEFYANNNNKEYLLDEFSHKNELTANKISYGSNFDFIWECPKCNSTYEMQMAKRVLRDFKCPYCKGRRVNSTNSLNDTFPDVLHKWNYNRNILTPSEVYCLSTKKYWWKCDDCKSDYSKSVYQVIQGIGCPYCTGQKANHTNSLANLNPTLASEWHPTKNGDLTPNDVTCGSTKKPWWICDKCNHEWNATVSHRANKLNPTGCPVCVSSLGERKIRDYFIKHNIKFEFQKCFNDLNGLGFKNLSYDFYIEDLNLLLEFHGVQHYHYSECFHVDLEGFKKQKEHDRLKEEYAGHNNFNLLIIKYNEIEMIENILKKELNNIEHK